jgi:membrane-associated phospholipid phosphatase
MPRFEGGVMSSIRKPRAGLGLFGAAMVALATGGPSPAANAQTPRAPSTAVAATREAAAESGTQAPGAKPPSAEAEQPPGIGALLRSYPRDLKRFWSKEDAVSLGVGGGLSLASHVWDAELGRALTTGRRLNDALKPGNLYGAFPLQAGTAFGAYLLGRAAGRPHLAAVGADVVRAQLLGQSYVQLVKVVVRRDRPDGSAYSFPSGHAASAFATASVLQHHYGYKMGIPAYALAAYVAAARISDTRHYLSDVVFGAAVGFAAGHTVMRGHRRHRLEVGPVLAPSGVALVVRVGPPPGR